MSIGAAYPSESKSIDGVTTAAIVVTILAWASAFPAIRAWLAGFRAD